ncbi:MAG: L-rhamnose mutarotase, partial [Pirellulales bacterium]|nr:L-rhamnose mutarotase [Pirellulales bacterium]
MKRLGAVARVKPEMLDRYVELHAAAWPTVLERIRQSNIQNYSIFL